MNLPVRVVVSSAQAIASVMSGHTVVATIYGPQCEKYANQIADDINKEFVERRSSPRSKPAANAVFNIG